MSAKPKTANAPPDSAAVRAFYNQFSGERSELLDKIVPMSLLKGLITV
jgi:hypothetical protein